MRKSTAILIICVLVLSLYLVSSTIKEHHREVFQDDLDRLELQLLESDLIEQSYKIDFVEYEDNKITICFDIHNYTEDMEIDTDRLITSIYEQYKISDFKSDVKLQEITIFDWKASEDGTGGRGTGIASREYNE